MRALGFCVSVEHARSMASRLNAAGLATEAPCADSPGEQRMGQHHRRFRFDQRFRALPFGIRHLS